MKKLTDRKDRLAYRKQYSAEEDIVCSHCKNVTIKKGETVWARGTITDLVILKCKNCSNKFEVKMYRKEDNFRYIKN